MIGTGIVFHNDKYKIEFEIMNKEDWKNFPDFHDACAIDS